MNRRFLLGVFKKTLVLTLITLLGGTSGFAQSGYGDFIIFEDFGQAVPHDPGHEYYSSSQNGDGGDVYFRKAPLADISSGNLLFYRPGNPPWQYWVGDDDSKNWGPQYIDEAEMGSYSIVTNSRGYRNIYFHEGSDHTGNDLGYMLLVDAHSSTKLYFDRLISGLCAGTRFEFSAWIKNVNNEGHTNPRIKFDIVNEATDEIIDSYSSDDDDIPSVDEWY